MVAIVGATESAGQELLEILEERNFPVGDLVLLASEHTAGERLPFKGRNVVVRPVERSSFNNVDISFFFGGQDISREFASIAVQAGSVVIDGSGVFFEDAKVPVVVPEVNDDLLLKHAGIIAIPGASAISMSMVMKPIHDAVKIKRIVATTLQSVSGTGKSGMDELAKQTVALLNFHDLETAVYPHQIAFNCLPHIDSFQESGYTKEEKLVERQTKRILGDDSMRMTVTAVRVPVFRCDAMSVNVETDKKLSANEARALLSAAPGIMVFDDPMKNIYPTSVDVAGKNEVFVGRIHEDASVENGISIWIVTDNLRKGAALNATQIAEKLIP